MKPTIFLIAALTFGLSACGGDNDSGPVLAVPAAPSTFTDTPGAPVVALASGSVRGAGTTVLSFKGIPFARPPVGNLRWTAPVSPDPWTTTRDATSFGPQCIQLGTALMSEDCLFVNVWAPKTAVAGNAKLPVMVWVYGGSFTAGNGNVDGTALATRGAVVVSMNYRVSTLGFMAHPQLSAESADKTSGNYGVLDIAQALRWVKANIDRFGGDPAKVTIWGESAGASAITAMMSSPRSAGLYQKVILESPGSWRHWKTLATAEQDGTAVGASIAALRALPVAQLPVIQNLGGGTAIRALVQPRIIGPVQDGVILPHMERLQFETGGVGAVPLLVGNNTDEGAIFTNAYPISTVAGYQAYMKDPAVFGAFGDIALGVYPVTTDAQVKSAIALSFGDDQFWFGARGIARLFANKGEPVWRYYFTRKQAGGTGTDARHGDDVAYVFGDAKFAAAPYTAADVKLSGDIMDAWVRFASGSNPNGASGISGITTWPRYDSFVEPVLMLDTSYSVVNGPRNAQLDFVTFFDSSIPSN